MAENVSSYCIWLKGSEPRLMDSDQGEVDQVIQILLL